MREKGDDTAAAGDQGDIKPVPLRHPGRWLGAIMAILVAVTILRSIIFNPKFEWPIFVTYFLDSTVLWGVLATIGLSFLAMAIGLVIGTIFAIMRISSSPVLAGLSWIYINFFRAVPVLVQLIFWYNLAALYPIISIPFVAEFDTNTVITPLIAAMLGLGLNEGANLAEIIRGGIISIDRGQSEAARALGMRPGKTLARIVLPQALKVIAPPIGNQIIMMLKMTSLVSIISMQDLLYATQTISARTFYIIPMLIVAAIWYLILTVIFSIIQISIEKYFSKGAK
jgi:polar amino acid transport system permease protein